MNLVHEYRWRWRLVWAEKRKALEKKIKRWRRIRGRRREEQMEFRW